MGELHSHQEKSRYQADEKVVADIKKQDKKGKKKLWILCGIGILEGWCSGIIMAMLVSGMHEKDISLEEFLKQGTQIIRMAVQWISPIVIIAFSVIMRWMIHLHMTEARKWDGEDETFIEKVEKRFSIDIIAVMVAQICFFILFGISFSSLFEKELFMTEDIGKFTKEILLMALNLILFVWSVFYLVYLQKKIVNMEKELNPEKKGSVYDPKFIKDWMNSCDEAEQLLIGKASFKAYRITLHTCLAILVVLILIGMCIDIGVLPLVLVGTIMLVLCVSYGIESIKSGHVL